MRKFLGGGGWITVLLLLYYTYPGGKYNSNKTKISPYSLNSSFSFSFSFYSYTGEQIQLVEIPADCFEGRERPHGDMGPRPRGLTGGVFSRRFPHK